MSRDLLSSFEDAGPGITTRAADHSAPSGPVNEDNIVTLFTGHGTSDIAGTTNGASSTESLIISGVRHGWMSLSPRFNVSQRVMDIDERLRSAGHGTVARMVFIWYLYLIDDSVGPKARDRLSSSIPTWWITTPDVSSVDNAGSSAVHSPNAPTAEQTIFSYIPWSAARERMQRESTRYCCDRFFRELWKSTRFIWPFAVIDAIETNKNSGHNLFSAELLLRAGSIRSFTVTKDFLDKYTEFRGEIPQLEPSATWYRPEEQRKWEAVFWAWLRKRRSTRLKEGGAVSDRPRLSSL